MPKTPAISQRANWKAHVIEKTPEKREEGILTQYVLDFISTSKIEPSCHNLFYSPFFLLSLIQLKRGFDEPKPTLKFMISKGISLPCGGDNFQIHLNSTYPWNASWINSFLELTYGSWKCYQKVLQISLTNMKNDLVFGKFQLLIFCK